MRGRTDVKLGIKWVLPNLNGNQLNVHKTPGTSGYLPSLPFSLSLSLFSVSLSPLLFLFVFHSSHVTQPLKDL